MDYKLIATSVVFGYGIVLSQAFGASYIALGDKAKYPHLKHFEYVNPNAPKGGILKSYVLGSFSSLNQFVLMGDEASGLELVYDTLMAQSMDEPYAQYALVASDIEVSQNNDFVIFTLNPNARFSDGVKIKAEDVKFSFDMMIERGNPLFKQYYADVKEAKILSESKIQFVFKTNQNRELPLILGQLVVLPKHFYLKDGKNTFGENPLLIPLGSGPYTIKSFEVGKKIIYQRNKAYWARDLPSRVGQFNFDEMVYEYYKDDAVALQAFLNHQYDWRLESMAKVWARGYEGKALESHKFSKITIEHNLPTGMQGFFMNTRTEVFANPLVRKAMIYAFNFEWSNLNLFFSQYERTTSYFNHSVFASSGIPNDDEKQILRQCDIHDELPKSIYTEAYNIPKSNNQNGIDMQRENLKYARDLLKEAGFVFQKGVLVDSKSKKPLKITLLLDNPAFERLALQYARNLKVLGIVLEIQKIDSSQYTNRVKNFDFDIIVGIIGQSLFPGNEQRYFWGSASANQKGSRNYSGIHSQAIDCLIGKVINAKDRQRQILATKALDRALLWGDYVVPHYFLPTFRIAFWNNVMMPEIMPRYDLSPQIWWSK